MTEAPQISVILPVYNAEKYIAEAVESILSQTYSNFELIIINDGSSDNSGEVIKKFTDNRIVYLEQSNQGLAATLNRGISIAKGKYIARQDNDDVSLPQRLVKQLQFMEANPEIVLCGTRAQIVDHDGQLTDRFHKHSTQSKHLKFELLFDNPFVHSSVFFRKNVIEQAGLYNTDRSLFEDYELWSRIARTNEIANLPEVLLKYREVSSGMSKTSVDYNERVKRQSLENIRYYCNDLSQSQLEFFVSPESLYKKNGSYALAFKEYAGLMNTLVKSFCHHEKINESEIELPLKKQKLHFMRILYNSVIYSEKSSSLEKFKAKLSRKLMFIKNKSILEK